MVGLMTNLGWSGCATSTSIPGIGRVANVAPAYLSWTATVHTSTLNFVSMPLTIILNSSVFPPIQHISCSLSMSVSLGLCKNIRAKRQTITGETHALQSSSVYSGNFTVLPTGKLTPKRTSSRHGGRQEYIPSILMLCLHSLLLHEVPPLWLTRKLYCIPRKKAPTSNNCTSSSTLSWTRLEYDRKSEIWRKN